MEDRVYCSTFGYSIIRVRPFDLSRAVPLSRKLRAWIDASYAFETGDDVAGCRSLAALASIEAGEWEFLNSALNHVEHKDDDGAWRTVNRPLGDFDNFRIHRNAMAFCDATQALINERLNKFEGSAQ